MDTIKYDHAAYMCGECGHKAYYEQFATPAVQSLVAESIGMERIMRSNDDYFNDIPLTKWDQLDVMIGRLVGGMLGASNASTAGGQRSYSLCDTVSVAKAAARILKREYSRIED